MKENLEDLAELTEIPDDPERAFTRRPGEFVLGSTAERVRLPTDLVGRLEGKSSLGRLGLLIHSTAGVFDAGWGGPGTPELSNLSTLPTPPSPRPLYTLDPAPARTKIDTGGSPAN